NSEADKIAALLRHVQQDYVYRAVEFGRRARVPQPVAAVLHNHFGDCKDHALLLHQLLGAAGIQSHLALVRANDVLITEMPSLDQFDHVIVFVPPTQTEPRARIVDCTDKGSGLGNGNPYSRTHEALLLAPAKPRLIA